MFQKFQLQTSKNFLECSRSIWDTVKSVDENFFKDILST